MMKPLACGMALTLFLKLMQNKIDLFITLDRLCLLVLTFCTVSSIRIVVKSHIGTSLVSKTIHCFHPFPPTDSEKVLKNNCKLQEISSCTLSFKLAIVYTLLRITANLTAIQFYSMSLGNCKYALQKSSKGGNHKMYMHY